MTDTFLPDSLGDLWFRGRKHKVKRMKMFQISKKSQVNGGIATSHYWGRNAFSKWGKPGKSIMEIEQAIHDCTPSFYLLPIGQRPRATGLEL